MTDRLLELTRSAGINFIRAAFPEAQPNAEFVWEFIAEDLRSGLRPSPSSPYGYALAEPEAADLHCLFTFTVISQVLTRLRVEPAKPSRELVQKLFHKAIDENRVPSALRGRMIEYLVPYVHDGGFYEALAGDVEERWVTFVDGGRRDMTKEQIKQLIQDKAPKAVLDLRTRTIRVVTGRSETGEIELTAREMAVLEVIFKRAPDPVTREELEEFWLSGDNPGQSVYEKIGGLRGKHKLIRKCLVSRRGVGYHWVGPTAIVVTEEPVIAKG